MRRDYCNDSVPGWLPAPLVEGWRDAWRCPYEVRLYRRPRWRHALWRLGNLTAKALFSRQSRLDWGRGAHVHVREYWLRHAIARAVYENSPLFQDGDTCAEPISWDELGRSEHPLADAAEKDAYCVAGDVIAAIRADRVKVEAAR